MEMSLPLSFVRVFTGPEAGPAPALLNARTLIEYLQKVAPLFALITDKDDTSSTQMREKDYVQTVSIV